MKFLAVLFSVMLFACNQPKQTDSSDDSETQTQTEVYELTELWSTDTTLRVPESVIFDDERDLIYVSNINGQPLDMNNIGFISKLSSDGEIIELKWVEGMNAPKGMAIAGNSLFVTDIDHLLEIDIQNGEVVNRIKIDSAKFLNDVAADPDGNLYISDSEIHTIFKYANGEVEIWLDEDLSRPNGLHVEGDMLMLASSGSGDFASINLETKEKTVLTQGIGAGDGVAYTGVPNTYFISDWNGEVFYVDADKNKYSVLKTKDANIQSADITYVPEENMLLVPTFFNNRIVAYSMDKTQSGESM